MLFNNYWLSEKITVLEKNRSGQQRGFPSGILGKRAPWPLRCVTCGGFCTPGESAVVQGAVHSEPGMGTMPQPLSTCICYFNNCTDKNTGVHLLWINNTDKVKLV